MHDKETAILQEQVEAMQSELKEHLSIIAKLADVVDTHHKVLTDHLKSHKENKDDS